MDLVIVLLWTDGCLARMWDRVCNNSSRILWKGTFEKSNTHHVYASSCMYIHHLFPMKIRSVAVSHIRESCR